MPSVLQPVLAGAIALLFCASPGLGADTLMGLGLIPRNLRKDRAPTDPARARMWYLGAMAWQAAWSVPVALVAIAAATYCQRDGFIVQLGVAALACSAIAFGLLAAEKVRQVLTVLAQKKEASADLVAYYRALGVDEKALALMRDGQEYRSARLRAMQPDPEAKP